MPAPTIPVDLSTNFTQNRGSNVPFKPSIEVTIDGHYNSKVYTSGSSIVGRATINTARDVEFDSFEIVFTGIASTRLDFIQQFPSLNFRPFMKLRMPLSRDDLPASRVFEAGTTYTIPFNFIVPHQLTIGACSHSSSLEVQEQHLRLPPTVGNWEGDDQAPEMASIEYAVKARAIRRTQRTEEDPGQTKLMEGCRVIKVLPAMPEDAPLEITKMDERYSLHKSKTIRKSLFSGKTGKLNATALQPNAVMLTADGRGATSSSLRINLEFAPSSSEIGPPRLGNVSGKLQAVTFFSASPTDRIPSRGPRANITTNPCLNYSTTSPVFSVSAGDIKWKQELTPMARRDSGYSSSFLDDGSEESDSSEHNAGTGNNRGRRGSLPFAREAKRAAPFKYTATLDIPFNVHIPSRKVLLPTFFNCLVSRAYVLHVNLGAGPTNSTISMAVPLQVGVISPYDPPGADSLPSFESAMAQAEEEEVDAYLRPRLLSIPPPDFHENSVLPGYEEHRRRPTDDLARPPRRETTSERVRSGVGYLAP
jgi:hypothetical protein